MADFRRWKVDFDQNSTGLVDRKPVPDPPGYMSQLRGVVSPARVCVPGTHKSPVRAKSRLGLQDAGTAVVNQSQMDRMKQAVSEVDPA